MPLYFATGNKGKAREAQQILGIPIEITEIELDEIQSLDLKEIVEHKLKQAFDKVKSPVIVDDVALKLDVWNGFPGPFVKYLHVASNGNNKLILKMLKNESNRNGTLVATIGYHDGENIHLFIGEIRLTIAVEERGTNGWGLDPILIPEGQTATYAEMSEKEKNSDSHRKRALKKLKEFLDSQKT
ncbi:MAG: RdgB/HAM1 family non-canonical purine NTP pyrophosphatase [Candidatus Levybacteria bacterium]|nr:RdgB/HAM1 family non-canonical purine NTP pyrophosphatase [Candidatus Levybacteria bacterium]